MSMPTTCEDRMNLAISPVPQPISSANCDLPNLLVKRSNLAAQTRLRGYPIHPHSGDVRDKSNPAFPTRPSKKRNDLLSRTPITVLALGVNPILSHNRHGT